MWFRKSMLVMEGIKRIDRRVEMGLWMLVLRSMGWGIGVRFARQPVMFMGA